MKHLKVLGVQSYPYRALITKQLGTIPISEEKYQEICLQMGIWTDKFMESVKAIAAASEVKHG